MEIFKIVPAYSWLFFFANTEIYVIFSIKLIEKLSRRHLINSSDVFVIKDFTVIFFENSHASLPWTLEDKKFEAMYMYWTKEGVKS